MKLFRLRFILLGLLLCLYRVWCLTCGTEFDDAATSAYRADVVVIGVLTQRLPPVNSLYNATVTVSKSRNVLKGQNVLRQLNLLRRGGGSSLLTVGQFGVQNAEFCYADVDQGTEYIFFLKRHFSGSTFDLSAMPVSELNRKHFKRAKRDIKKILCKKNDKCVKQPEFDEKKRMKDLRINAGRKIELNCRLQKKPLPNAVFTWLKNGKDVNTLNNRRLRIKTSKKGSRLSIRRAAASDSGLYKCIARNIGGSAEQEADIVVSDGPVQGPEVGEQPLMDVQQKLGSTLRLSCKIKYQTTPETKFRWQKDGQEIRSEDGVSIRSKGDESKLRKTNITPSDQGVYTCFAENQGGTLKQQSRVTVYNESVGKPEVGHPELKDINLKFKHELNLVCKIKQPTIPTTKFRWEKDGKEIKTGDKPGLVIRSKGDESTLRKSEAYLPDEGVYSCIAESPKGKLVQSSFVKIVDGPKKKDFCGPYDSETYCLNNGTCYIYTDIDEKFCECPKDYRGIRCERFTLERTRRISEGEEKLAQDRAFVIVGIISGILLFIGICVASYFLAKQRRDRFHRRRNQQRVNGHIEDIPQVYRPLIGCDDIDGLTKKMNGVLIHKETQTTESCFIGDNTTLYISPVEGYVRNDGSDRGSRSRKAAVSLEEDPRNWVNRNNNHNESMNDNENKNFGDINNLDNRGDHRGNDLNVESDLNDHLNDLSPRHKPIQRESEPAVGANPHIANIPSPKSTLPPAINLDTSDEEIPGDGTPLTPLHISEDEDNSDIFKKCKPKTADGKSKSEEDNLFKKCKPKNINDQSDAKGFDKEPEVSSSSGMNPRPHRPGPEKASNIPNTGRHERPPHMNIGRQGNPNKSSNRPGGGRRENALRSGPPPPNARRRENPSNPSNKHPPRRDEHNKIPRPKETNMELPVASPENNTAVSTNGLGDTHYRKPYTGGGGNTSTSKPEDRDSDSSTSTEGCDSPNTAWLNSQEFSDHSPEHHRSWSERGSPESSRKNAPPYFNLFPKHGDKSSGARDRRDDEGRNNKIRPSMKDKFSIAI